MKRILAVLFLALAGSAVTVTAFGQAAAYPSRPIRLIVPAAPGGGTDILGRLVGKKFSEHLGQHVIIDNRAGAGGLVGTEQAARMPPDGYTVLIRASQKKYEDGISHHSFHDSALGSTASAHQRQADRNSLPPCGHAWRYYA